MYFERDPDIGPFALFFVVKMDKITEYFIEDREIVNVDVFTAFDDPPGRALSPMSSVSLCWMFSPLKKTNSSFSLFLTSRYIDTRSMGRDFLTDRIT